MSEEVVNVVVKIEVPEDVDYADIENAIHSAVSNLPSNYKVISVKAS